MSGSCFAGWSFEKRNLLAAAGAFGLLALGFCPQVRANLNIVPVFDSTITSDPNAAVIESTINYDIATIDSYIANPITVTITFGESNSSLGGSSVPAYYTNYADYLYYLQNSQTLSAADVKALATLPDTSTNPVNGNTQVFFKRAAYDRARIWRANFNW